MNLSIQAPEPYSDGSFVLHKIEINGNKYSAWFDKAGNVTAAERFSKDNQKTFNVPLTKQKNIAAELTRIGQRFTGRTVPTAPAQTHYALLAEYQRGGSYDVSVKCDEHAAQLARIGWIVFDDPAILLAEMESGKKMLNMRFEKRNAIMDRLRAMVTPPVTV
jgi:hypothetical protein